MASPEVTGAAAMAATEVLWALSGRRFDECEVTLLPCRDDECASMGDPWGGCGSWGGSGWYTPALIDGQWYNLGCAGGCQGGCSCNTVQQFTLPGPVARIVEIVIDGDVVPTGSYVLYNARYVVRVDGDTWPLCNDPPGSWTATVRYGHEVPQLGILAATELMCEFVKACTPGEVCRLPVNVTAQTRQGISQQFIDTRQLIEKGFVGLYLSDLFIQTFNPGHLRGRPRAYNPDAPGPRWSG
jgi:hypothetical protein